MFRSDILCSSSFSSQLIPSTLPMFSDVRLFADGGDECFDRFGSFSSYSTISFHLYSYTIY